MNLHPAAYSYVVVDVNQKSILDFECDIHSEVSEYLNFKQLADWIKAHHNLLNQPFETKCVAIAGSAFQILPSEELAESVPLLFMNKQDESSVQVLSNQLDEQTVIQFGLDARIFGLLTAHIDQSELAFSDLGFAKHLMEHNEDGVFCHIMDWDIAVAVVREGQLQFLNKYRSKSPEDSLYYILLAYQAHDLDPLSLPLHLAGLIDQKSPLFELLYAYIKQIDFLQYPNLTFADGEPDRFQPQYHFNLFNLNA